MTGYRLKNPKPLLIMDKNWIDWLASQNYEVGCYCVAARRPGIAQEHPERARIDFFGSVMELQPDGFALFCVPGQAGYEYRTYKYLIVLTPEEAHRQQRIIELGIDGKKVPDELYLTCHELNLPSDR